MNSEKQEDKSQIREYPEGSILTLSVACREFNVSRGAFRRYEQKGLLKPIDEDPYLFRRTDLERIAFLVKAKRRKPRELKDN